MVITRVFQLFFNPPSLWSQREFSATFVPYSRHYYAKAIFILTGGFNQAIRHSRRSGNPEPTSCAKTVLSAKTRRVDSPISHLDHSCGPASGWMGKRVLDSRCGENDRGQIKGPVVTTPTDTDDIQPAGVDLHLDHRIPVLASSRLTPAAKRLDSSQRLGSKYQGWTEPTAGRFYHDLTDASGNSP